MVDIWSYLWLGWFAAFVVIEGVALWRRQPNDTLSEHVWKWFGIGRPGNRPKFNGWVQIRRVLLLAGVVWLAVHFMTGGVV